MPTLAELTGARMPNSGSLTEYQLGTLLYWWLRNFPEPRERMRRLADICSLPIVPDETEAWLSESREELRVTREDAAKALEIVRSTPHLRAEVIGEMHRELEKERTSIEGEMASLTSRHETNASQMRRCAVALYARSPSNQELLDAKALYDTALEAKRQAWIASIRPASALRDGVKTSNGDSKNESLEKDMNAVRDVIKMIEERGGGS